MIWKNKLFVAVIDLENGLELDKSHMLLVGYTFEAILFSQRD